MSSIKGNWSFQTRRYRVEYREYGEAQDQIRLAMVYRKANDIMPIGSASTILHGRNLTRKELLHHALYRAENWLMRRVRK